MKFWQWNPLAGTHLYLPADVRLDEIDWGAEIFFVTEAQRRSSNDSLGTKP